MNKFEKQFIRMMANVFCIIMAITISMRLMDVPNKVVLTTLAVQLLAAYFIKRWYWARLERLELQEMCKV